jgi:16S rRNA processing protein RimM
MVLVGRIARPQGTRGEVIIDADTDFPEERFAAGGRVFVERDGSPAPLEIAAFRMHAGRPVVRFDAIESMDQAETLRGLEMRVPESELGALPENVWYHHQLLGSTVRTKDGRDVPPLLLEAARAINDVPLQEAMPQLAQVLGRPNLAEPVALRALNANFRIGGAPNAAAVAKYAADPNGIDAQHQLCGERAPFSGSKSIRPLISLNHSSPFPSLFARSTFEHQSR